MIAKYRHKRLWKLALLSVAVLIGVSSIVYTNYVVQKLSRQERVRAQLIREATKMITVLEPDNEVMTFLSEIVQGNTTTPIIITDTNGVVTMSGNLDSTREGDTAYFLDVLAEMRAQNEPMELKTEFSTELFYYGDSSTIIMLRYYPYIQLFIISLFIGVSYLAFSSSRRFEQNQVWVGMSKETAHQLGTPLSSLIAWVEYFRQSEDSFPKDIVDEIEKDVKRLEVITERFSRVGSQPVLEPHNTYEIIEQSISYLERRVSKRVSITIDEASEKDSIAYISTSLFEWVIENLCKNAVDAMEGKGSLNFLIQNKEGMVFIDVKDTGRGIPAYLQKTVFNPGYTTRKRGWGLGLSLAKRIIESYHYGQIYVLQSDPKSGTTFRIKLPKTANRRG